MWSKKSISQLDKYYPPYGSCWLCGHKDKRHRMWDEFLSYSKGGESAEFIAELFKEDVEYIKLVLKIKPYHRNNY
jgi:hypothetical protein